MNTTPPIVGVPVLVRWVAGPMDRIGWPALRAVNTRTATGVPNREMMNAAAAATMTALTREPRRDPDLSRRPHRAMRAGQVGMMRAAGCFLRGPLDHRFTRPRRLVPVAVRGRRTSYSD